MTRLRGSPPDRTLRWIGAVGAAVSPILAITGLLLATVGEATGPGGAIDPTGVQISIAVSIVSLTFPVLGWLIVRRQPRSRLGWIYLTIGALQAVNLFALAYAPWAYRVNPDGLPAAAVMSWLSVVAWMPAFTLLTSAAILLFPDGRLPSRRWWPVLALAVVALLIMFVPEAIAAWPYRGRLLAASIAEGSAPPPDPMLEAAAAASFIGQIVLLVATFGSIAGIVARWRRSGGVERLQIKWFGYGALVELITIVLSFATQPGILPSILLGIAMGFALPVTIGIAILRFHLWDIDRLISRTLSYTIVTGFLAAVFAGLVLGLQDLLASVTGAGTFAVAASTLVVVALFQPVRLGVQRVVDRRFDRSRYDAQHTVSELSARLRNETDLVLVHREVVAAVRRALAPASAGVWTRGR